VRNIVKAELVPTPVLVQEVRLIQSD